jgi:hypothetical protein
MQQSNLIVLHLGVDHYFVGNNNLLPQNGTRLFALWCCYLKYDTDLETIPYKLLMMLCLQVILVQVSKKRRYMARSARVLPGMSWA